MLGALPKKYTPVRLVQEPNTYIPMLVTLEGIVILVRPVQE